MKLQKFYPDEFIKLEDNTRYSQINEAMQTLNHLETIHSYFKTNPKIGNNGCDSLIERNDDSLIYYETPQRTQQKLQSMKSIKNSENPKLSFTISTAYNIKIDREYDINKKKWEEQQRQLQKQQFQQSSSNQITQQKQTINMQSNNKNNIIEIDDDDDDDDQEILSEFAKKLADNLPSLDFEDNVNKKRSTRTH